MAGVRRRRVIGALAGPLLLQARGGSNEVSLFEGPVARPSGMSGVAGDIVTLDGSTSTPAQGAVSRYEWLVEAPDGSTVALFNGTGTTPSFLARMAGAYRVSPRVVVDSPFYSGTAVPAR